MSSNTILIGTQVILSTAILGSLLYAGVLYSEINELRDDVLQDMHSFRGLANDAIGHSLSVCTIPHPEVMLGLLPGAGGTQRLPKLTTVQNVLDLTLTGKKIKADKAKKIGIVDRVIQPLGDGLGPAAENTHKYLEEIAVKAAQELANGKLKINRDKGFMHKATQAVMTNSLFLDNVVLKMAKDKLMKLTAGNYPAPLKILDVVRTAYVDPKKGFEAEAKAFGELSQTFQSKALIGLFDGSTDAKKVAFF